MFVYWYLHKVFLMLLSNTESGLDNRDDGILLLLY